MNIQLEPAVVLHRRPYRETSLLIDMLTENYGLISLISPGARKSKSKAGQIQPFQGLLISCKGKGDLFTLTDIELTGWKIQLSGTRLYCGLYLNELLIRCLQRLQPVNRLLQLYFQSVEYLQSNDSEASILRQFEWLLIDALGYAVSLDTDKDGNLIEQDGNYLYVPDEGLVRLEQETSQSLSGCCLLELHQGNWGEQKNLTVARKLTYQALKPLIGNKPFISRRLYQGLKKVSQSSL